MKDFKNECEDFIQTGLSLRNEEKKVKEFVDEFISCLSNKNKLILVVMGVQQQIVYTLQENMLAVSSLKDNHCQLFH